MAGQDAVHHPGGLSEAKARFRVVLALRTQVTQDTLNKANTGKRKSMVLETLPGSKKSNVIGVMHEQIVSASVEECTASKKRLQVIMDHSYSIPEGSSIRKVDNVFIDFRCTICQKIPIQLNRSELYRHYAFAHFSSNLMQEFGHLKTCPVCNIDLKISSICSHYGQKHSHVEDYLPVEAWIPLSKLGANRGINRKLLDLGEKEALNEKVKKVNQDNFLTRCPLWLEIPQVIDIDKNESLSTSTSNKLTINTVNGIDLEPENVVKKTTGTTSEMCSPNISALECRICKERFDSPKQVVHHLQTAHGLKRTVDVNQEYEALLNSGYIVFETEEKASSNVMNAAEVAISYVSNHLQTVGDEAQFRELTEEELVIVTAVGNCQRLEELKRCRSQK